MVRPRAWFSRSQRLQHLLGGVRVELRGGLVQHQQARAQRQGRGDGHALALAAGKRLHTATAQRLKLQQGQRLGDPRFHFIPGQGQVLQRKSDLILHPIDHKLRLGILEDEADMAAHALRRDLHRIQAINLQAARELPAAEVRHQPIGAAQQGRFARPGSACHQRNRAGGHMQRDLPQALGWAAPG